MFNPIKAIKRAPWKKIGKATAKVASTAILGGAAPVVAPEVAQQVSEVAQVWQPSNLLPIVAIVSSAAVAIIALFTKRPNDD